MIKLLPVSAVAQVNPPLSRLGLSDEEVVSFVPMAAVHESGVLAQVEMRAYGEVKKGYTAFKRGDVLVAKITPCMENGKAAFTETLPWDIGFGSTEFHVLRPNVGIDGKYLFYMVWNPHFRFHAERAMTGSAGQKRVPASFIEQHEIPVPMNDGKPDLAEQRRIAAILDKADAICRKRQQSLALTDELIRSAFLDMFGDPVTNPKEWPEATIGEIAEVQGGLQLTSTRSKYPIIRPYLRVANVYRDHLELNEVKTMGVNESEAQRALLNAGDILVVEGHGNPREIGRCAVWTGQIEGCLHQNHLIRVRCGALIRPSFLSAFLNSEGGRRQMFAHGKTTSGLNTISTRNVKSLSVLLPPIDLQDSFCDMRAKAMTGHSNRAAHLQQSEHLFSCCLQRAFAGAL